MSKEKNDKKNVTQDHFNQNVKASDSQAIAALNRVVKKYGKALEKLAKH